MYTNRGLTAGIDEVGIGPIAGPAVFGMVVLRDDIKLPLVGDSKKLSDARKFEAATQIMEVANDQTYLTVVSSEDIDRKSMGWVWQDAVANLVRRARQTYPFSRIVVDGNRKLAKHVKVDVEYIVGADALVLAVSAASVVAKCHQILHMEYLDQKYPEYGFLSHRGYGTPEHTAAIMSHGALRGIHRRKYVETLAKNKGFTVRWRNP